MLEILEVRFDERVVGGELKHCESAWYQAARGWRSARARPGRKRKIHKGVQMGDEGVPRGPGGPPHQAEAPAYSSRSRAPCISLLACWSPPRVVTSMPCR